MKGLFLTLLVIFSGKLLSQNLIVKDLLSQKPIENATLSYQDKGVVTNKTGMVNIDTFNNDDIIKISHLSYHSKQIVKKNIFNIIYLNPKTTLLPSVSLTAKTKIPLSKKYPLFKIRPKPISLLHSSTANLIASESSIVVQESQSGGGSPNYRGMEANRLLLVVDGTPLNNAIYRSGHMQSSATINPFFIESVDLVSAPASVAYGNGAMGGALIFNTLTPFNARGVYFRQQFESSSNAVVTGFKANYQTQKFAHVTAFSLKSAGNLKMGNNRFHGYKNWGNEKTITNNSEQLYTNFSQVDFMHKSHYKVNNYHNLLLISQYSKSSNIYRFDKMNDIQNGLPKYQKWYYGPQIRFLQSLNYTTTRETFMFDKIKSVFSFQDVKESRHIQKLEEDILNNRKEHVRIYDFYLDFNKTVHSIKLAYGIGSRNQNISSTANLTSIDEVFYNTTRYPDGGSIVQDFFAYSLFNLPLNKKTDLLLGLRWNNRKLNAVFRDPSFPFSKIENKNTSFVKSILLSYKPISQASISASYYGGFRNPNLDDVGKIFSKDGVNVVVPNSKLQPEYANNYEVTCSYTQSFFKTQIQLFRTEISNAISREYGSFNGLDSIIYDGTLMRVQMNTNINVATITGASFSADFIPSKKLSISASFNYLKGEKNKTAPLAHIPPFNSKLSLNYEFNTHLFNFYINHNAWKKAKDYDEVGVDNLEEATAEGSPEWYTLNIVYRKNLDKTFSFNFAITNILDAHFKTFGSGISSSGRNFIFSLDANF